MWHTRDSVLGWGVDDERQAKWLMVLVAALSVSAITVWSCRAWGISPLVPIVLVGAAIAVFRGGSGGPPIRPA